MAEPKNAVHETVSPAGVILQLRLLLPSV